MGKMLGTKKMSHFRCSIIGRIRSLTHRILSLVIESDANSSATAASDIRNVRSAAALAGHLAPEGATKAVTDARAEMATRDAACFQ